MSLKLSLDIATILQSRLIGRTIHPTSIAYVSALLNPYIEMIEILTDPDAIRHWLRLCCPNQLGRQILTHIETIIVIEVMRKRVIEYLIEEIGCQTAIKCKDDLVLPWDFQNTIGSNTDLSNLFGVTSIMKQLPITVVFNNRKRVSKMMTCEMAYGAFLISQLSTESPVNFQLFIYNTPLTNITTTRFENFTQIIGAYFTVDVSGDNFQTCRCILFRSQSFIEGITIGSKWIGVNSMDYYRNYTEHNPFKITIPGRTC
jgi:hypothetical protein